ncbi:error-prone DNA polymerase [Variovorax sp. PCZ-1]|uniref:error-prone DNA polymerase n=1 Tax=Variovorax sp. PCZ-1 TaxID=2835533 RepID=UPI001BD03324|nr:error-prone DNA polymerase [Variovorax sp. PCZ-1]MBS7806143.1 error-prone DNA polymerase [Variovorax sp. PCZ-1]
MDHLPDYAELHALSNFSFQRGASHPEELVARAHGLGYRAIAITDECSVAGVVRAHGEAKKLGIRLVLGAEFKVQDAPVPLTLVLLVRDLIGWSQLCEFITRCRRSAGKGEYRCVWAEQDWEGLDRCEALCVLPQGVDADAATQAVAWLRSVFGERLWLALSLHLQVHDELKVEETLALSAACNVPVVATGAVLMHVRSRKPLHDVITAVAQGKPVAECGYALMVNAEAHLRPRQRLAQIYSPEWLAASAEIAARCTFSLEEIRYQYPTEVVGMGETPAQCLERLTYEGAQMRYPAGLPEAVQAQILHELTVIGQLNYEMYFLTVHDLVRFARSKGILCQGRGSAANSAVCYCLGVTEVDPARMSVLFERFVSSSRGEPPDIDVDFEHQRREEVFQYIYNKYGRDRSALAATVVSYRPKSALRDVGKALAVPEALIDAFSGEHFWFDGEVVQSERVQLLLEKHDVRLDWRIEQWLSLAAILIGFPRHLSQHPGGFVLTKGALTSIVPVENAAMPDRSIIQWDKDDLDAMGLMKVDVLALGMLSAIRRCLDLVSTQKGQRFEMQDIPAECPVTYEMICAADTVGVFQIESRAQQSMLPRLRPQCFYDLVVEVAIVRPGPIQGGMVHPYLKRRQGIEPVTFPSKALEEALGRTLGVPIFQEQVMQIAMLAAGFSADEADQLRRSMAAWKRKGGVGKFYERIVTGMTDRGYTLEFAQSIFKQIEGFGEYGFPESHAASFALLVYVSCWLKCHYPAAFLVALLNAQPLGFYSPAQLVQDAQRHDVKVLPVDVMYSDWETLLLADSSVRLGLQLVKGLSQTGAQRLVNARQECPFESTEDLALRAALDAGDMKALAAADALRSLSGHRRQQVWEASALKLQPDAVRGTRSLLRDAPVLEEFLELESAGEGEEVSWDYNTVGLTLRSHPLALLRPQLEAMKMLSHAQLQEREHGRLVRTCGLVTMRQQPQTAKGTVFVTLEDETGSTNVIVWKRLRQSSEEQRNALLHSRLMVVHGRWEHDTTTGGRVRHLIAGYLQDVTPLLGSLLATSRDFR